MSDSHHDQADDADVHWRDTTIDSQHVAHDPETMHITELIHTLRQSIDNVDTAVVSLLAERFKVTAQVGALKAKAGFAPADYQREDEQIKRLRRVAQEAGLDPEIAEMYREFVVTEVKKRHQRIAETGEDPGVLDVYA